MATYRVSPQFIFAFISAAIVLAFFIHRYQMATAKGEAALGSKSPQQIEKPRQDSIEDSIEEIPSDWVERVPAQKNSENSETNAN